MLDGRLQAEYVRHSRAGGNPCPLELYVSFKKVPAFAAVRRFGMTLGSLEADVKAAVF